MKTKIAPKYDDVFVDAARMISKADDPPVWLLVGLNHFRTTIGNHVVVDGEVVDTSRSWEEWKQKMIKLARDNDLPLHIQRQFIAASSERELFNTISKQMDDAASVLLTWLPAFQNLTGGIQCPDDVTVVLDALPRIKEYLALIHQQQKGRAPNGRRTICAAVVLEAWKLIHGKAAPRSDKLYDACKAYWRACGGEEIGAEDALENWRRRVKDALAINDPWVRQALALCRAEIG